VEEAAGHSGPDAMIFSYGARVFSNFMCTLKLGNHNVWSGIQATAPQQLYFLCLQFTTKHPPFSSIAPARTKRPNPRTYLAVVDLARDVGLQARPAEGVAAGGENKPRRRRPIVQANLAGEEGGGGGVRHRRW